MNKSILLSIASVLVITITKAQTTAMQFSGQTCDGITTDLFADLDAGKAVILHFFMPNCSACPPPAQDIQAMANNINMMHPGKVKGYAFPFNNATSCTVASNWVSLNGLSSLYEPMDSGAAHVAHYGGFGMPTVVVVGGADHRVLFVTQSFISSDTTIMRDSIMGMLAVSTGISQLPSAVKSFSVFPNPANESVAINLNLNETSNLLIDITDITGKQVAVIMNEKQSGSVSKNYNTQNLPIGNYFVRLQVNGKTTTQKLNIIH